MMALGGPGKQFLHKLIMGQSEELEPAKKDNDGKEDVLDNDASAFSTKTVNNVAVNNIYGHSTPMSHDEQRWNAVNDASRNVVLSDSPPSKITLLDSDD